MDAVSAKPSRFDTGLEVVENNFPEGIECAYPNTPPEDARGLASAHEKGASAEAYSGEVVSSEEKRSENKIQATAGVKESLVILGAVIFAFIVVAVGAGLGASLKQKSDRVDELQKENEALRANTSITNSSSLRPTGNQTLAIVDLTNYTVADPGSVDLLHLDCPDLNDGQYVTFYREKFSSYCDVDFHWGLPAKQGGNITDLVLIIAYSAEDCMEACSGYNYEQNKLNSASRCRAMTFRANLAYKYGQFGGNCWLKNDTVEDHWSAPGDNYVVSAEIM